MIVLIGLVLAGTVLYVWLLGHWFGRVLAFLAFGGFFSIIVIAIRDGNPDTALSLLLMGSSLAIGWVIASIPTWVRTSRIPDISFNDTHPGRDLV